MPTSAIQEPAGVREMPGLLEPFGELPELRTPDVLSPKNAPGPDDVFILPCDHEGLEQGRKLGHDGGEPYAQANEGLADTATGHPADQADRGVVVASVEGI